MPDLAEARRDLGAFAQMVGKPMRGWQARSLQLVRRTTVIVAPRQSGKSRSLSVLALHRAFRTPGLRVLVISAGDDAAKRLLAEVRSIAVSSPMLRGSVVDDYAALVTLTNGSEIRSVPASERQIRGWSVDLLLIDEAALVPDDLLTGAAIPTTAARPDARIVIASSASVASGVFYDLAQAGLAGSEHIETFMWRLVDADWIGASTIAAARESMTPTRFAAEYEGVFASGADALFPRELLDRSTADFLAPGLHGLRDNAGLGGVDWGATTDRTAMVCIGRLARPAGLFAVIAAHAWRSGEPLDGPGGIIGQIADLPARWEQVTSEVNGLGFPLSQALARRLEARPGAVGRMEFVSTSQESKSATYSSIRMLLEQGRLVFPASATELLRELLLLRVELTASGGERIEASKGHDDLADALYLATGPWRDSGGTWRNRVTQASEQSMPPVSVDPEDEGIALTGSGFALPREPEFVRMGGARHGDPFSLPSPLDDPAGFRAAQQRQVQTPLDRWFAEIPIRER